MILVLWLAFATPKTEACYFKAAAVHEKCQATCTAWPPFKCLEGCDKLGDSAYKQCVKPTKRKK